MKNYGLNINKELNEIDGTEYVFSASSPDCIFSVPVHLRKDYLPIGELQKGKEDFQDCVTRKTVNIIETKLTYAYRNNLLESSVKKFLENKGYVVYKNNLPFISLSDRYIAIRSGTTRDGNSLKAPAQAAHEWGVIPKSMLPANSGMTFDEYHNKISITKEIENLGKEFLLHLPISYDQVSVEDIELALKKDFCGVAVDAWGNFKDGEYHSDSTAFGHDVMAFEPKTYIFDNYPDSDPDNLEWVKKLAPDYRMFKHNYRIYFTRQNSSEFINQNLKSQIGILSKITNLLSDLINALFNKNDSIQEVEFIPPKPMSNQEKFLKVCLDALDTEVSPDNPVPDEVSCARDMSILVRKLFPDFKIQDSTKMLDGQLFLDKRFDRTKTPSLGAIWMYPAKTNSKGQILVHGHVLVQITSDMLASNNSKGKNKGMFTGNYTIEAARKEFRDGRGLTEYIYQFKN